MTDRKETNDTIQSVHISYYTVMSPPYSKHMSHSGMSHNIAAKSKEERNKVNVDLAASGVAYKERMNMPVIPMEVEMQQPDEYC